MEIKCNLYYNKMERDFFIDYNIHQRIPERGYELLLRSVFSDKARAFISFAKAMFPEFYNIQYFPVTLMQLISLYDKHYNNQLRVKRVKIVSKQSLILVEKSVGDTILKGTRFYCGCCGEQICESTELLTFPFTATDFHGKITNKKYTLENNIGTAFSLWCNLCEKVLFFNSPGILFATIEDYFAPGKSYKKIEE